MPETINQIAKTIATTITVLPGHTSATTPTARLRTPAKSSTHQFRPMAVIRLSGDSSTITVSDCRHCIPPD